MTTVAVSTEPPVIDARPERGRLRVAFDETFGFIFTWLRLLWRHWPAMLALALAGTVVRELLLKATFAASTWRQGLGTMLVLSTVPLATLFAMVLMLRVVRPSLPYLGRRSKPEPVGVFLASVLIPFLLFYFTAGYSITDQRRFAWYIGQDILTTIFVDGPERFALPTTTVLVGLIVGAFLLRSLLNRFEIVRRQALLAVPLAYLEVLWLYASLIGLNTLKNDGQAWLELTKGWRTLVAWWHVDLDPANPFTPALTTGRQAATAFFDAFDHVVIAPVTALVAGSIVLAARTRYRPADGPRPTGLRRVFAIGVAAGRPVGGRFGLIADGVRRVFQAGVAATMLFCLVYLATSWATPLLFDLERLLIGPRDDLKVWHQLIFPLWYINDAVALVLLMSLIAAFVDRTAARIARRAGAPAGTPAAPIAGKPSATQTTGTLGVFPEQTTTRLGPPPMGGATAGTPSYGGFSPVTPTYTSHAQPPPSFGSTFGSGPGLAPPTGPSATPPAGLTGGLWDGKPDEPGQTVIPGDEERGRPGIGR